MSNERRLVGIALFAITVVIILVWGLSQVDTTGGSAPPDIERLEFDVPQPGEGGL